MKYAHELYTYMMHTIHTYILHIHSREGMCWTERKATGLGVEELVMAELQLSDSLARAPTSEDVVALAQAAWPWQGQSGLFTRAWSAECIRPKHHYVIHLPKLLSKWAYLIPTLVHT